MSEKNKITIYDLAKRLNTTASTVSRALQNNARISPKMRKAVQELAAELNYIPDPVAHHLRTGKGNVLGIIVPRIDRNFFAAIISAFQKTVQKQNYNVIITASNESNEEEMAALKALLSKKVDGIAMSLSATTTNYKKYEEMCAAQNTPLLYFDRVPNETDCDTVANDNYQIGYDAVVQFNKIGCKKIGHFAGPMHLKLYSDRYEGCKQAIIDLNLSTKAKMICRNCITLETGAEAAMQILASDERPDAIFSAGDFSAITAMDTFHHKGLRIPEDIAIIGVANEPFDSYLSTPLASFDLHQQRIGELAANLLLERLAEKDEKKEPQHVIVQHELIARKSAL